MLGIDLNRNADISLSRQIYQALRIQITEGRLHEGEALPSTREMAANLAVSRNTVSEAYDMLLAEGYLISRQGAPTRVAPGLTLIQPPDNRASVDEIPEPPFPPYAADFKTGQPDIGLFPRKSWLQYLQQAAVELEEREWAYAGPEGQERLRFEISQWLFRSRGMQVSPGDIFVCSGATQALSLAADLLAGPGNRIIIEDPCHIGMLRVLCNRGFHPVPVPVDRYGLQPALLPSEPAAAIYVTPSHQFPLGGILPAGRRTELVSYAMKHDIFIIEDDYDSEFRYAGPPVSPLYTLAPERVIYVGTFSKNMYPALRIGYTVIPAKFHRQWRFLRRHNDVQSPPFEQAALTAFLASRSLDRHVRRMRKLYEKRRKALLYSLADELGDNWNVWGDEAGLHLAVEFPGWNFSGSFSGICRANGVRAVSVEHHAIFKGRHLDKILLGYGHLPQEQIPSAVALLAACIAGLSEQLVP